jgi:microcystin-dependent protein
MIATNRKISAYLAIQRVDGSWADLSQYLSQAEVELGDVSSVGTGSSGVDGRVRTLRFTLKRSVDSFSPRDKTSFWNILDGAYSPLLWPNRRVRLDVIVDGIQTRLFEGLLGDSITADGSCECRDLAKALQDCYIETKRVYGSEEGVPAEVVIQQILADNLGAAQVALYCPVSPGFTVLPYELDYMSVWDAIQQVAQQFGWFIGYRPYGSEFKLTLMEPPRDKVTADYILDHNDDIYVQELEINDADVRNAVVVTYRNSVTGERDTIILEDNDSIADFGRRAMQMEEADTSLIDTAEEAERFAQAALSDLKDLPAVSRIDIPLYPAMDVFAGLVISNPRVSSTLDFYAVNSVRHVLDFAGGKLRTEVIAGGKVVGGHAIWLGKETRPGADPPTDTGEISPGAIDTDRIGDQQVTGIKIEDLSITSAKIAEAVIEEAHIKDAAITGAKIGDLTADKIKAGVLTVTDQVGEGAAAIVVRSGGYEKVRLDDEGILVNDGNIMVRNDSGATVISPQGVNVETTNVPLSQSFNYMRNAFFKVLNKGDNNLDDYDNRAYKWILEKSGNLRIQYGQTAYDSLLEYGVNIGSQVANTDSGTVNLWQGVAFNFIDPERPHCISVRHRITNTSAANNVRLVVEVGSEPVFSQTKALETYDGIGEYKVTSIAIPSLVELGASSGNVRIRLIATKGTGTSTLYAAVTGFVMEQGLRPTEGAYDTVHEFLSAFEILPGTIQPEHLASNGGLDALIGVPLPWYDTEPPAWAFVADGRYLNPNSFPKLFEKYGYRFGSQQQVVDGSTVIFFRIPDLRGEFIRGLDLGRGVDSGRTLGSWQEDEFKEHQHQTAGESYRAPWGTMGSGSAGRWNGAVSSNYALTSLIGGAETRPRNVAFMYIIPFMSIPLGGGGREVDLGTVDVVINQKPKYVSPWFAVSKAQTYTRAHSLGGHPSNVRVQFSPKVNPGPNDKIVNYSGLEYAAYNATVAFDATNVYIYFGGDRVYDGPDGNTSGANPPFGSLQSGYARILAWE